MREPPQAASRKLLPAHAEGSRDPVAPLRAAFEAAGFDVAACPDARPPRNDAIDQAVIVTVCWTPAAVASDVVNLQGAPTSEARQSRPPSRRPVGLAWRSDGPRIRGHRGCPAWTPVMPHLLERLLALALSVVGRTRRRPAQRHRDHRQYWRPLPDNRRRRRAMEIYRSAGDTGGEASVLLRMGGWRRPETSPMTPKRPAFPPSPSRRAQATRPVSRPASTASPGLSSTMAMLKRRAKSGPARRRPAHLAFGARSPSSKARGRRRSRSIATR